MPPASNGWANVATLWRILLAKPDQAAHAIGKLFKQLGTHRLLWGTHIVWYGRRGRRCTIARRWR